MTNEQARQLRQRLAHVKQADSRALQLADKLQENAQVKLQGMQRDDWARIFAGSLGLGSVLAGLSAYRNMQQDRKPKKYPAHIQDVPVPYVQKSGGLRDTLSHAAQSGISGLFDMGTSAVQAAKDQLITPDAAVDRPWLMSTYPLGAGAALAGGLYLGNNGVRSVLSSLRKSRQQAERDKQRDEFRQELLALHAKTAATLTRCYGHIKSATGQYGNLGNYLRNGSLLAATLALPYGFAQQYQRSHKYSDRQAVEDALKLRARIRAMQQPSDLYASLEPVERTEKQLEPPGE